MRKKIIRLSESDLRNVIKESVNSIISELNWRTYASAADKAYAKGKEEKTPEERHLRDHQAAKFHHAAKKGMEKQYDGVNMGNYDDRNIQPSYKRVDNDGNTVGFLKNNFTYLDNVVPVSKDKQVRGSADIARFRRGGDEYVDGKWRKKVSESQYSDEPFVLSGDHTEREKKKIEKKRKDSEKRKQNAEKNEQNKKAKEKEESDKLINQQRELYNYRDLFGN
jgi:hypothetical protein